MGKYVTELRILKTIIMLCLWLMLSCITYITASPVIQDLRFRHEMNQASNIPERCEHNTVTPVSCADVNSADGLLPHPDDCQLFYYCIIPDLPPICRQCPASLHFNPVLRVCDYPQQAGCKINTTTTTTTPANTTEPELTTTGDVNTTWVTVTIPDKWNTTTESSTETLTTSNNTAEDYTTTENSTETLTTSNNTAEDFTTESSTETLTTSNNTAEDYTTTENPTETLTTSNYTTEDNRTTEAATTLTEIETPTTALPWLTTGTSELTWSSESVETSTLSSWATGTLSTQETEQSSTTISTLKWKFLNAGENRYTNTLEIA